MIVASTPVLVKVEGGRTSHSATVSALVKEKIKSFLITNFTDTFDAPQNGANIRIFPNGLVDNDTIDAVIIAVRSGLFQEFIFLEDIQVKKVNDTPTGVVAFEISYTFDETDDSLVMEL